MSLCRRVVIWRRLEWLGSVNSSSSKGAPFSTKQTRSVLRIGDVRLQSPPHTRSLPPNQSVRTLESPLQSLFCGDDLQIIGHRKDSWDAVGEKGDQVLVGFAVHDALQGNLTVLHDDADGLLHAERVFL